MLTSLSVDYGQCESCPSGTGSAKGLGCSCSKTYCHHCILLKFYEGSKDDGPITNDDFHPPRPANSGIEAPSQLSMVNLVAQRDR
jgi:hypothetical protein